MIISDGARALLNVYLDAVSGYEVHGAGLITLHTSVGDMSFNSEKELVPFLEYQLCKIIQKLS